MPPTLVPSPGALAGAVLAQTEPVTSSGGLTVTAHVFLAAMTVVAVAFILRLVRRRQMAGKYALLWTVVGVGLVVIAVFPGLLDSISESVGIYYPPALFLLLTTGFLFVVAIHFSWELSRLEDRSRTLAEEVALLREELERSGAGR